ncbi:hypothetical protein SBI67_11055 [Mycolicibacterium sp. 120266]|uniref:hypothetical protein n=1 Tax=Mycolicibacterium sp. 120266 TaxID=3090601 RepID=UPI00299E1F9F|nr:hypothetical protein [Mycolicibacterium sp. 120266]MDX1872662.1 hypothetical protein [Mycolicibacterium sp. 120266]
MTSKFVATQYNVRLTREGHARTRPVRVCAMWAAAQQLPDFAQFAGRLSPAARISHTGHRDRKTQFLEGTEPVLEFTVTAWLPHIHRNSLGRHNDPTEAPAHSAHGLAENALCDPFTISVVNQINWLPSDYAVRIHSDHAQVPTASFAIIAHTEQCTGRQLARGADSARQSENRHRVPPKWCVTVL